MKKFLLSFSILLPFYTLCGQENVELLPFGDMENWTVRYIKESRLLGGKTKTLYVLGPCDTIGCEKGNQVFVYQGKTPWGISNAYANVVGIAKGACTTQPERRGNGWCARLDTRLETVKVFGVINLEVAIAGTLFFGEVLEPIRSANDPYKSINIGIPFTRRPKALMLDLKTKVSDRFIVTKALGLNSSEIEGHDEPEIYLYLQKRWEDSKGNIYAKRIATMRQRFDKTIPEWQNDCRLDIHYGDISSRPDFKKYQGLFPDGGVFCAKNSRGEIVQIQETGWGTGEEQPTHIILMITAGCYPAFYGAIGNALWVDNIRFVF